MAGYERDEREGIDLGVKQAPFVVLIGANMPSVLAEISFVTNADEGGGWGAARVARRSRSRSTRRCCKYQRSLKGVGAGTPRSSDAAARAASRGTYNSGVLLQQPVTPVVQIAEATHEVRRGRRADRVVRAGRRPGASLALLAGMAAGASFILTPLAGQARHRRRRRRSHASPAVGEPPSISSGPT